MPLNAPPIQNPVVDRNGVAVPIWIRWFTDLYTEVDGGGP